MGLSLNALDYELQLCMITAIIKHEERADQVLGARGLGRQGLATVSETRREAKEGIQGSATWQAFRAS